MKGRFQLKTSYGGGVLQTHPRGGYRQTLGSYHLPAAPLLALGPCVPDPPPAISDFVKARLIGAGNRMPGARQVDPWLAASRVFSRTCSGKIDCLRTAGAPRVTQRCLLPSCSNAIQRRRCLSVKYQFSLRPPYPAKPVDAGTLTVLTLRYETKVRALHHG